MLSQAEQEPATTAGMDHLMAWSNATNIRMTWVQGDASSPLFHLNFRTATNNLLLPLPHYGLGLICSIREYK
jgi:hypothetical protein